MLLASGVEPSSGWLAEASTCGPQLSGRWLVSCQAPKTSALSPRIEVKRVTVIAPAREVPLKPGIATRCTPAGGWPYEASATSPIGRAMQLRTYHAERSASESMSPAGSACPWTTRSLHVPQAPTRELKTGL
jgi:hypothetical protein